MNYNIAKHALESNFEIVNDVSGFNDLKMIQLIIEKAPKIILVHSHPKSSDIQEKMDYKDVVKEVRDHLEKKIDTLISHAFNVEPNLDRIAASEGKEDARKD